MLHMRAIMIQRCPRCETTFRDSVSPQIAPWNLLYIRENYIVEIKKLEIFQTLDPVGRYSINRARLRHSYKALIDSLENPQGFRKCVRRKGHFVICDRYKYKDHGVYG